MRTVLMDQNPDEVGRLTAIFFGLVLLFGAFVLGALGFFVLLGQETRPGLGGGLLGGAVLYGAWCVLVMSWRLFFNRPRREGGLLSPRALRVIAYTWYAMTMFGLYISARDHFDRFPVSILGAVWAVFSINALLQLAASRKASRSLDRSPS